MSVFGCSAEYLAASVEEFLYQTIYGGDMGYQREQAEKKMIISDIQSRRKKQHKLKKSG